jgi:histidinol dehydrogenase
MNAEIQLHGEVKAAIDQAMANIQKFHEAQITADIAVETLPGVTCRRVSRPIQNVGLYIPGGTAPLPSTAMMLTIPAAIAGCKTIVLATPPDENGDVPDSILYIAQKTGVQTILKAGGAQAIAAMAYGTETVPRVDKIFGPGNQFVTAAKMMLQNSEALVSIDMPAGPSEVLVIADESADPVFVAADLLSQAEHGTDSQVVLVHIAGFDLDLLSDELERQTEELPRREIASESLKNSFAVRTESSQEAMEFSNRYAPEHLIIQTEDAEELAEFVTNAGSVFIGKWTPESMGDYASGTNHTLPTYGYARMYSGVSVQSYQKTVTMQTVTEEGIRALGPTVEKLASIEGLDAHGRAVTLRLQKLDELKSGKSD